MTPQKMAEVKVLIFLVFTAHLLAFETLAASSSKSKSRSSKASRSSSTQKTSGHQYAPSLLLKPSKPDPHFEILDEQRGINYRSRLRDGRNGSQERKPTKLKEATVESLTRSGTSSVASSKKKSKKDSSKSIIISPASIESTFMRKSTEVADRTLPIFSGSQLISGEAGPLTHRSFSKRTELVQKDGWKILMGPSVSPDESGQIEDENMSNGRTFTSMTDDIGHHRTITRLKPVKKGKSLSPNSKRYYDVNEISNSKKVSKIIEDERKTSLLQKGAAKRTMQVAIPKQTLKHKYATITRRAPSKLTASQQLVQPEKSSKKMRKPPQPTKLPLKPSKQIKSSLETRYASIENDDLNEVSPVMVLDSKKLVIEPVRSSAKPTSLTAGPTSMSVENYSGERELRPTSISYHSESRYDPIPLPISDSTELVDGNDDDNDFQMKTALHSAEYPLISVSTSMNYPHNHPQEQGGIITASSSSNMQLQLDEPEPESDNFPDFPPITHSHFAGPPESAFKDSFFEESESLLQHTPPPTPPHVEFVGVGSKTPLAPPPIHGTFRESRLPLHYNRLNTELTPSFHTSPLELSFHPDFHFRGSVVPSENSFVTAGRSPHFSVGTSRQPPHQHKALPRPPEPFAASSQTLLRSPHPLPIAVHDNHRGPMAFHPIPRHRHPYHHPRHPPIPLGPVRPPPHLSHPFEVGSGRKAAPPGDFVVEIGKLVPEPNHPPPPIGIDPDHPAVQHALRNPHTILNDGVFIEPTDTTYAFIQKIIFSRYFRLLRIISA